MLAAGIKTPVPLEELEIHLHEEMSRTSSSAPARNSPLPLQSANLAWPANSIRNFTGPKSKPHVISETILILLACSALTSDSAMALPVLRPSHPDHARWPTAFIELIYFSAAEHGVVLHPYNASARGRQMVDVGVILVGLPCTVIYTARSAIARF